jgi:hypothetical protein
VDEFPLKLESKTIIISVREKNYLQKLFQEEALIVIKKKKKKKPLF